MTPYHRTKVRGFRALKLYKTLPKIGEDSEKVVEIKQRF